MCGNVKAIVEISRDDLKEHLLEYYEPEEIENMDLDNEITEVLNAVLSNYFSDFMVYNKGSIVLTGGQE